VGAAQSVRMKLILFTLLYHFVFTSGEISFECEKLEHFDDNPYTCSFSSECSLKDFNDYLANLTTLSYKHVNERNVTLETAVDPSDVTKIIIQNATFETIPINLFLKFPLMKSLTLNADIKVLNTSDFINASHLIDLDLENNQISSLKKEQFKHLASIKSISLAHNSITSIDNDAFRGIGSNLTHIDLSHNQLLAIREDFIAALISTQDSVTINLSYNKMNNFHACNADFPSNATDITLILSFNNISEFRMKNRIYGINLNGNRVQQLDVRTTSIAAENNRLDSFYISSDLEVVTLDNNRISSLKWDRSLPKLLELDLSDNGMFLTEIRDLFGAMPNVMILDLSHNKIDTLNISEALQGLTNLKHLSLQAIELEEISARTFENLIGLETLMISHNPLKHFNMFFLEKLTNLEVLQIDHTEIYKIDNYEATGLFLTNLVRIAIDGNLFTCKLLDAMFKSFISERIEVIDPDQPEYHHQNIKGIACVDTDQDIEPLIDGHNAKEIAYKFDELMVHIKDLQEKQQQVQDLQPGVTMTQLIISNVISIGLSFAIVLVALAVASFLRSNRYQKFMTHPMDDIEILGHEL
jgi:Leucine-rich repeat (LRR) protein